MNVLLLDLDDTLIADVAARDEALRELIEGPESTAALLVVRQEWRRTSIRSLPVMAGVSSWEALWIDFDAAAVGDELRAAGHQFQKRVWQRLLPDRDSSTAERFRLIREELVRPYDWVAGALDEWRQSYALWCVTNGSSWLQRRKLHLAGLTHAFTMVIASGDVGVEKVDPRFHAEVDSRLARLGSVAAGVVGDSQRSDGLLAQALAVSYHSVIPGTRPSTI